jgi:hypothetical protein
MGLLYLYLLLCVDENREILYSQIDNPETILERTFQNCTTVRRFPNVLNYEFLVYTGVRIRRDASVVYKLA